MPANGQKAAGEQLNNIFGNGLNQKLNALNTNARTNSAAKATDVTSQANPAAAPPNASAAPTGNNKYTFLGLCEALNAAELQYQKDGSVEIPNFYEVQFSPPSLASSKLKMPGETVKALTPMQQDRSAAAVVNSDQNSMNTSGLNRSVSQGTQIVQFIETVMRNSTYITDQLLYTVNPESGNSVPSLTSSTGNSAWFKINVQAVPIGNKIDTKRNDYAYHMTYIITPYAINQSQSQYFPPAKFRGVHKVYNYWFTGDNTQVLHYEQSFNNLYYNVINGQDPQFVGSYPDQANSLQWQNKRVPSTRSGQNDQGSPNGANNPASTQADFLYSQADQSNVNLKIIGDPAWIMQGEIVGLTAANFNFQGFYPDGTINADSGQAIFVINWNSPADYNQGTSGPSSGTGLMDINSSATQNNSNNLSSAPPKQSAAYAAISVKSTFSKGKFEQELQGVLMTNLSQEQLYGFAGSPAEVGRNTNPAPTTQPGIRNPAATTVDNTSATTSSSIPTEPRSVPTTFINTATEAAGNPRPPTSEGVEVGPAYAPNSPPDAGRVTVYGLAGPVATTITPSAESVRLGAGEVVVYGAGGTPNPSLTNTNANVAVTVNNIQQTMSAKDA
jgi:hypothetical protein